MSDKIFVGINNKRIELKNEKLGAFLEQRAQDEIEQSRIEAEQQAKEAARQSAMDKLAKLGLTPEEIAALVP